MFNIRKPTFIRGSAALLIFLAVVIAYGPGISSSFHFDDRSSICRNPVLTAPRVSLASLWSYWPTRFVTTLTFFLNYRLGGLHPGSYHLINLLLHAADSILVYLLILSLSRAAGRGKGTRRGALGGALIFALHPLQTEAVSYIAQRAVLLMAFFYLAGLLFYLRGRERKSTGLLLLSWLSGGAALLCKEPAFTFPLVIILLELIFPGRKRHRGSRLAGFALLFLVIPALIYLHPGNPRYNDSGQTAFLAGAGEFPAVSGGIRAPGRGEYALTQLRVAVTYLRLVLFPVRQNLDYDYPVFSFFFQNQIIGSLLILVSVLTFSCFLMKKKKTLEAFGLFFFFITLLPESSVIPIRDVIFEHRLYLPLAGLVLAVSCLFNSPPLNFNRARLGIFPPAKRTEFLKKGKTWGAALILLLGVLTVHRNFAWRDEISLWRDTCRKSPGKGRPFNNLGYVYNRAGDYRRARESLRRALENFPGYAEARVNLAISLKNLDRPEEAEKNCREALRLKPDYPEGYNCLGDILRREGKTGEAEEAYRRALQLNPALWEARNNLANLYQSRGEAERAGREYRKISPAGARDPAYLNNLGLHYLEAGKVTQAIAAFKKGLDRDGKSAPLYYNLGNAYALKGEREEAISCYNRAIRLRPDYASAYFNRGIAYREMKEWPGALASFEKTIELKPGSAPALLQAGIIAALYTGQPERAYQYLSRAVRLQPELKEKEAIRRLLDKLKPRTIKKSEL